MKSVVGLLLVLVAAAGSARAAPTTAPSVVEIGPAAARSAAPAWDARGLGALPWQGVACLDAADDCRSIVVGTIAPQGDWNLLQLDDGGKIIGEHVAGQRWVNEAAISADGRFIAALCATPEGTAGDVPRLYGFLDGKPLNQLGRDFTFADFRPQWCLWHYGEHSNHLPRVFCRAGNRVVVAGDQNVYWLSPGDAAALRANIGPGLPIAMAASPSGLAVVGRFSTAFYYTPGEAGRQSEPPAAAVGQTAPARPAFQDLLVVRPDEKQPLVWSRPAPSDVATSPRPEAGIYGPAAPPHEDVKFEAPLAVAIDRAGERIAVADYEGWQRVFHPRDGSRDIPFGTRFTPSRPTIHVYDLHGNVLRRIGPENFSEPFWCDLAFSPDGKTLLISPHNWTSRGLGGQPLLPADDNARTLYTCRMDARVGAAQASAVPETDLRAIRFPDAISSADCGADGTIAVACWNRRLYLLNSVGRPLEAVADGIDVGAAALVRSSKIGPTRFIVATTAGVVTLLDQQGKKLWQTDLNQAVTKRDKPWTKNQKADAIAPGLWHTNGSRAHSDLGNQIVIEAPRGLILIDPNAGESFEQNWARMVGAGLDPMRIQYVLLTHEHGDHAPGARLWRVVTGAKVVAGATTAYDLQHLTPLGTGYGFHPPTPVDMPIEEDTKLDLAGLSVKAICLPGHTYGSMGYVFEKSGRTYAAIGDLIMPTGVLGYAGSMDFSAADVLRSLHKVAWFRPDMILGGHGIGNPDEFIAKGIEAGEETGWSQMTPPAPNPFCRFTQKNYLIVAWREPIVAAAYGDIDGDGRPDVAVLVPKGRGSLVKIYLNRGGKFADAPDAEIPVPDLENGAKLRLVRFSNSRTPDLFAASEDHAVLLLAQPEPLHYKPAMLPVTRATEVAAEVFPRGAGTPGERSDTQRAATASEQTGLLIGSRFTDAFYIAQPRALAGAAETQPARAMFQIHQSNPLGSHFLHCHFADLTGRGRDDVIISSGDVFLRRADGGISETPTFHLAPPSGEPKDWAWVAAGDFEHNGRLDVAMLANGSADVTVWLYRNTGDPAAPFAKEPSAKFTVADAEVNRDGPTVADWNGDGAADLILCKRGNEGGAFILTGSPADGLNPGRIQRIKLDYIPYYDARFGVIDFAGAGRPALAGFGRAQTGATGVYIWLQP